MPVFRFRLEAQDGSGHYRQGAGEFASKEEATRYLEFREARYVHYRAPLEELTETDELCNRLRVAHNLPAFPKGAGLEDKAKVLKAAGVTLATKTRAHLAMDAQEKPYKLVKLEQVS